MLSKVIKSITFSLFLFFASVIVAKNTHASEGQFVLKNTNGQDYWCYALSVFIPSAKYHILVTCENLIYPPDVYNSKYMLWGYSAVNEKYIRLGELGIGKATFDTKEPFNQLFVTLERDPKTKSPTSSSVMSANLERINSLENFERESKIVQITESPKEGSETISPAQGESESENPDKVLTTKEKLLIGLKRSSLIAGIALVGLLGLIFVLTRTRG